MARWAYLHQLFQVHDVPQAGRVWAVRTGPGVFVTLDSYLDSAGARGFELVSFTVESLAHRDHRMYVGYQVSSPSSARALFKKRVE